MLIAASLAVAFETMPQLWLVISLGCAINVGLFVALHRVKKPAWSVLLRVHVCLLMIPIMTAFLPLLGVGSMLVLLAVFLSPATPLVCRYALARRPDVREQHPVKAA